MITRLYETDKSCLYLTNNAIFWFNPTQNIIRLSPIYKADNFIDYMVYCTLQYDYNNYNKPENKYPNGSFNFEAFEKDIYETEDVLYIGKTMIVFKYENNKLSISDFVGFRKKFAVSIIPYYDSIKEVSIFTDEKMLEKPSKVSVCELDELIRKAEEGFY